MGSRRPSRKVSTKVGQLHTPLRAVYSHSIVNVISWDQPQVQIRRHPWPRTGYCCETAGRSVLSGMGQHPHRRCQANGGAQQIQRVELDVHMGSPFMGADRRARRVHRRRLRSAVPADRG